MFLDDYDDAGPNIGYCVKCGALLDSEPAASLVCWDCMTEEG